MGVAPGKAGTSCIGAGGAGTSTVTAAKGERRSSFPRVHTAASETHRPRLVGSTFLNGHRQLDDRVGLGHSGRQINRRWGGGPALRKERLWGIYPPLSKEAVYQINRSKLPSPKEPSAQGMALLLCVARYPSSNSIRSC